MSRRRRRSGTQANQQNRPQPSPAAKAAADAVAFWGEPGDGAEPGDGVEAADGTSVEHIRPTPDPAALPRSLGDPPLTPDTAAAHHVAVVYEEAVRAATALAAANGLLDDAPT